MNQPTNLYRDIPDTLPQEFVQLLASSEQVRIERIVSRGHRSPPGFWYEQEQHEWVALLQGQATLRFEHGDRLVPLQPGDCLVIPAHARHRVEATAAEGDTVWLAVFY
ncbi:MAG: cupin domain-containing protein [Proteobacteria bacterium]|nr:cupin domain-containing protein [Pseudomonadota bacterium]